MLNQDKIIEQVIEQIKLDLANGDTSAIAELLSFLNVYTLQGYLPEVVKSEV
jgi:hypothetical protein